MLYGVVVSGLVAVVLGWGMEARAQEEPTLYDSTYEEIIVYGTGFERWDDTWWALQNELQMPYPIAIRANESDEGSIRAMQLRLVFHCQKTFPIGKKRHEVSCVIDDVGLKVVPDTDERNPAFVSAEKRAEVIQRVLDEADARLTGAKLRLQVNADGRVGNISLLDIATKNRRENEILEFWRIILARAVAGFHMRLRKVNPLSQGQWVEYDSSIMKMPNFETANMGSSMLVHQLDMYKGHHVVQSVGRGMVATPATVTDGDGVGNSFKTDFSGVSIYDKDTGFMTERVWSLIGTASSSSAIALFNQPPGYLSRGRLTQIDVDTYISVGSTEQVWPVGEEVDGYGVWESLE